MASLDSQIDELYRLPLAEFTAARNALAKTVAGADAQRIRHLGKPTTVPWAINQLYWQERPLYERLLKSGRTVRDAQVATLKGKAQGAELRKAGDAHRKTLADAAAQAARLAKSAGVTIDLEALSRTLEALSLSADRPSPAGRLTEVLRPAGFEALAGVTPADTVVPIRPSRTEEAERKRESEARRRVDADMKTAERGLARAREKASAARQALDEAEDQVRAAEEQLAAAKKARDRFDAQ